MVEHRDPAFEAAQRALPDNTFDPEFDSYSMTALAAAREALKPIRELHKPHRDPPTGIPLCAHDHAFWPCMTAELVYTSEELSGE